MSRKTLLAIAVSGACLFASLSVQAQSTPTPPRQATPPAAAAQPAKPAPAPQPGQPAQPAQSAQPQNAQPQNVQPAPPQKNRPVVTIDTFAPGKGAAAVAYMVDARAQKLDGSRLRDELAAVARDKARGPKTPVAVLLDPALSLRQVRDVMALVAQSGMTQARYFVYDDANRMMVAEMLPRTGQPFPVTRLESQVMAAPQ